MRKAIVITSAVISILFAIALIIPLLGDQKNYANVTPILDDIIMIINALLIILISTLVIFKIKLRPLFQNLFAVISGIFILLMFIFVSDLLFASRFKKEPAGYMEILGIISIIALFITLSSYIRQTLWPAEPKAK